MPATGKECKEMWKIPAEHVLYREDGTWYQVLKRFPGALCDANGYVLFKTEQAYKECPQLQIGKQVSVPGGIAKIPGYLRPGGGGDNAEEIAEALETTFSVERDLQRALRENIQQLEAGLTIVDGGKERIVPAGKIDITAKDKQDAMVVIELKAGEADKSAVGQVLSYMGDLLAEDAGKPVRGILVASGFKVSAVSAARVVPNLELKKYGFRFSFEAANR
jgi:hypothetical protein